MLFDWRWRQAGQKAAVKAEADVLEAEHGRGEIAAYYAAMSRMDDPKLSADERRLARQVFQEIAARHCDHLRALKRC